VTPAVRWAPGAVHRATSDPTRVVARRAALLRGLHRPGQPLLLPNVWDCQSARLVVAAGLPAVATSSAAVADSLGYADGEAAPASEMLDAIARITARFDVPVTADVERGYGMSPTELVERLVAAGAAGCNLEDSDPRTGELVDPVRQAEFLSGVRSAAEQGGVDLVVNARIDTYLGRSDPAGRYADTLHRARLYRAAGADCVYPIRLAEPAAIADLVEATNGPVNILAGPGAPPPSTLARLGVARISYGPHLYRAAAAHVAGLIADLVR